MVGSGLAFLAVALGAFGAHVLKPRLSEAQQDTYQTGVQYHLGHAVAMVVAALLSSHVDHPGLAVWGGWFLGAGIVFFSGSLYALSITSVKRLGAITPLGGLCFLAGWVLLGIAAV